MAVTAYRYIGLDENGSRVSGVVQAVSESAAYQAVVEKQLTPVQVKSTRKGTSVTSRSLKISSQDIATLTREMSVLVEASIPISRGLRSIAEHEKRPMMRDMVTDIANQIEAGEKLTAAFGKHRDVFGDVYIETIRAAERSGTLSAVTAHLADMLERNIETNTQLKRAMTYPAIVVCFVALALSVIVVFVVPRFAVIFESNGVELPLATQVITFMGESVKQYWWAIGTVIVVGGYGFVSAWKNPRGRYHIERIGLCVPYVGDMLAAITAARFSRVLSIGLDSGIEVIESMEVAGRSTGRPVFARECQELCDRMKAGESMETVLADSRRLPSFARRLLSAGKDSHELSSAGRIIARHYDRISDHLAKNINTIIEPLITIAIAAVVLVVALSVFLPMWKMVSINS
ncbi:MAG: type II secretion system F family protein [Phycisphaerales bacterium]